jgi:malonate decarboxylase delta subunit
METLEFAFASRPAEQARAPALRGVVGSGNLEVLIVPAPGGDECRMVVHTSARGFGEIWHAVLESFSADNAVGRLNFVINDMGATPAVVTLRLSQALAAYMDPHAPEGAPVARRNQS